MLDSSHRRCAGTAADTEKGWPAWIGFAVRAAGTCLFVTVFLGAISWLHRPLDWKCALSNIPLRPEAYVCGMVGESPMVAIPGMPMRLFGVEFRQSSQGSAVALFGEPFCDLIYGEAVMVQLPYSEFADVHMPLIAQAPGLRSVALDGTRITDQGLQHLLGLKHLETLSLGHTDITDKGAVVLGRLSSLKYLHVRGTRITGAALESLARLPRLESLDLSGVVLDAEGLAKLHLLSQLQVLVLNDLPLGDDDVAALGTARSLRILQMRGTCVTEAGVAKLARLIPLEKCVIEGAHFSRCDLDALRASRE